MDTFFLDTIDKGRFEDTNAMSQVVLSNYQKELFTIDTPPQLSEVVLKNYMEKLKKCLTIKSNGTNTIGNSFTMAHSIV